MPLTQPSRYCVDVALATYIWRFLSVAFPWLGKFSKVDVPGVVSKGAPDFCTVYVVSKGKISSLRLATCLALAISSLRNEIMNKQSNSVPVSPCWTVKGFERTPDGSPLKPNEDLDFRSPFTEGGRHSHVKSYGELLSDTNMSFVSFGKPSADSMFPSLYESDPGRTPNRLSNCSDNTDYIFESIRQKSVSVDTSPPPEFSTISYDDGGKAQLAEESALAVAEKEKAKSRAFIEAAKAAQRIAESEAQKRISTEMKALREAKARKNALESVTHSKVARYRKYTTKEIKAATDFFAESRKIGEGGYGPVYKCHMDHTLVAKVLRPDAAQGRSKIVEPQ
ncbi:hypothetical protein Ancab_002507 [Ancistrocladus abbreviatus]